MVKDFLYKWYPVILAFICLVYSVSLGYIGGGAIFSTLAGDNFTIRNS